jgi:hypothetical protein
LVWKPTSSGIPAARQRPRSSVQDWAGTGPDRPAPPTGGRIGQEDRDLTVLLFADGAGVLALDPGRAVALLHNARLVQHQHRIKITQLLDHVVAQVIPDPVGVPPRAIQQPLHPVWGLLPGLLGQPPAVLALNLAQQAL